MTASLRAQLGLARQRLLLFAYLLIAGLMLFACSTEGQAPGGFVSDDPSLGDSFYGGGDGGSGGSGNGGSAGTGGTDSPERAIEEADIVQTAGDRLYALSRYGGLSVIDVGTQDELTLLGRFKTDANPFEMYLRGDVVLALFDDYGFYTQDDSGAWEWHQSSRVLALDVSDGSDIRVLSDTTLAGSISDSRVVGNVLYVVSHEDGYCWECSNEPRTKITSFDIASAQQIRAVDGLTFGDALDDWGWGRRSISVTDQRIYVAGRDYDATWGSKIQIVDISNPSGDMRLGVALRAAGEIESRWQMDESKGVLRVISQPGVWNTSEPPKVQTFAIESSDAVTHLATLDVKLPKPERLRSVRFDGDRAFAITAEQTDPLFTFDLSDPAAPKQLGELEMPGWVYHMEPRGDRLLALGFDNAHVDGALHVSIFDVSDLNTPTLLSRVNFGGDWAYLPEDQDRIQKAFKLLEPEGLILVPFSGYGVRQDASQCSSYTSGIQLIDWSSDELTRRGVAPSVGQARRAFVMEQRLFTVSDDRVESFDFSDRDKPARTATVNLARRVSRTALIGDHLVRAGGDWWSDETVLDVVPTSDASNPAPQGSLAIDNRANGGCHGYGTPELFAHGGVAYVVFNGYDTYGYDLHSAMVTTVDASNPEEPKILGQYELESTGSQWWWDYDVVMSGSNTAMVGSTLAVLRGVTDYASDSYETHVAMEIVDLADPAKPSSVVVDLKTFKGVTGLMRHAGQLYFSHYEPAADGRVKFYLDRVDVSNPSHPELTKTNIPGSLLGIDAASGKLLNTTYKRHQEHLSDDAQCYQRHGYRAHFDYDDGSYTGPGTCTWLTYGLALVDVSGVPRIESSMALDENQYPSSNSMGDGVFFSVLDQTDSYDYANDKIPLHVISGFAAGQLKASVVWLDSTEGYFYVRNTMAQGKRAVVLGGQSLLVVDASDPAHPRVSQQALLSGYVEGVTLDADQAYVSVGYDGVISVPLEAN